MKGPINTRVIIALQTEARRAIAAHGDKWCGNPVNLYTLDTLAALGEEFGELCTELTYDGGHGLDALVAEAIQVGHLGLAIAQAALELRDGYVQRGESTPPGSRY